MTSKINVFSYKCRVTEQEKSLVLQGLMGYLRSSGCDYFSAKHNLFVIVEQSEQHDYICFSQKFIQNLLNQY